ncbi:MAG: hypothetical protein JRE28_03965 [Deltaproteobacteria bacterium]|nr:hypothetical protein [Deltaproteobacteria bacterium]
MAKNYKKLNLKQKTIICFCALLAVVTLLVPAPPSCAGETVKIGQIPQWPYVVINTRIIQRALEEKGYSVEIKNLGDLGPMFVGLATGDIHIEADYWLPSLHTSYREKYGDETILAVGDIYGADAPVALAIPEFVMKEHGIRAIPDLHDKSDLFDGKIIGYEPGTGGTIYSLKALKEYKLESEYKFITGTTPTMLAELLSGVKRHEPVIVVLWHPHSIHQQIKIHMLDDPKGVIPANRVQVAVNTEFANRNPKIRKFLENFRVPMNEMEAMMLKNSKERIKEEKLADQWYENNKANIQSWWK